MAQTVKNSPAMQETQVCSLGQKDPLKEETATHSSILAWRIPWTEESGGLQSMGVTGVGHDLVMQLESHSRDLFRLISSTWQYAFMDPPCLVRS